MSACPRFGLGSHKFGALKRPASHDMCFHPQESTVMRDLGQLSNKIESSSSC